MSEPDPLSELARQAESFRNKPRPPVRTVVSHAVYAAARDNPDLGMQHLVQSGHIVTWDMEIGSIEYTPQGTKVPGSQIRWRGGNRR